VKIVDDKGNKVEISCRKIRKANETLNYQKILEVKNKKELMEILN